MTTRIFVTATTTLLLVTALGCSKDAQESSTTSTTPAANEQRVEAACGQCKFGLEGTGCDLAVRFDGAAWYVDGSGIDDHGDAHGEDGMCNVVREAIVIGQV